MCYSGNRCEALETRRQVGKKSIVYVKHGEWHKTGWRDKGPNIAAGCREVT